MSHNCNNLLIQCMDFRLGKKHNKFAQDVLGNENYDTVALAGAQKALLDEDTRATVLKQIELSKKLHSIDTVVFLAHQDCGAYGGESAFANFDDEKAKYIDDMTNAGQLIQEKYPDLKIRKFIMLLNGAFEEV